MVVLGLGSNLGDRESYLRRAVSLLARGPHAPLSRARLSRVYSSDALVPPGAPRSWRRPYLNCALVGETRLNPHKLLRRTQEVERLLGREPAERWAPRRIDIDILWWEGITVDSPDLRIPHPGILERSFVLQPLRDLVPDATLEGTTFGAHATRPSSDDGTRAEPAPQADFKVQWPRLMGILNVTPDSFSDGGRYQNASAAATQAERLLDEGAEILDVGAESTRPDGVPVPEAEERARLAPVLTTLEELRSRRPFRLSLDSRNPRTVAWANGYGLDMINDVTGFSDSDMLAVARESDADLAFMHSLSVPVVKGEFLPDDRDPVEVLLQWGRDRLELFDRHGIHPSRLFFDPGIGFGKTTAQNWKILREIDRFHELGTPLLVGHSRKSFFRDVIDAPARERDGVTVDVSVDLARAGADVLRVHNVAAHTRRFQESFARDMTHATAVPVGGR